MEKSIITTAASVLLLSTGSFAFAETSDSTVTVQSPVIIASGQAGGGHESIEALKAEVASLKSQLDKTETGRTYLLERLRGALSKDKEQNDAQSMALQRATKGREFLSAQSKRNREKLMAERKENARTSLALERALRGRAYLKEKVVMLEQAAADNEKANDRQSLALERALRGRAYLKEKVVMLEQAAGDNEKASERQSLALERALRGRAYLKEKVVMLEKAAGDNEKASERQSLALERALRGRAYLKEKVVMLEKAAGDSEKAGARQSLALERALRGRAYLKEKVVMLEKAAGDNEKADARQSLALERALRGRAYLSNKVDTLETEVEQIAEVSFAQINSAIAERDAAKAELNSTDWADTLSADLSGSFSNLDGTEVTSLGDNSVAIKVGNTGLFSPGGVALSGAGKDLLGQIGSAIAERGDSHIKIVGHTDNIPTGSGSRFASNNELSLARATSALTYMTSIGVPADRLSVSGVGDAYPIASNDTEDGRLANRRVEIVLTEAK